MRRRVRKFEDLPVNAQRYVEYIEKTLGVPINFIGVGPSREAVILHWIVCCNTHIEKEKEREHGERALQIQRTDYRLQDRSCSLACVVERYVQADPQSDLDGLRILGLNEHERVVTPPKVDLLADRAQSEVVLGIRGRADHSGS